MKKNKYARFVHCLYLTDELADKLKSYDNKSKVIRTALYKHFAPKNNTELIKEIDENIIKKFVFDFNIENEIDNKLTNKIIFDVFNSIKPKWKEILILKFFEEKDYNEISDIILKPVGTVASMMNKAKKEFKKTYQEKYINY